MYCRTQRQPSLECLGGPVAKPRVFAFDIGHLARYRDSFLSSDHSHMSVNDMWVSFKSEVLAAIERFIPSKMTKTKYSSPWIDQTPHKKTRQTLLPCSQVKQP